MKKAMAMAALLRLICFLLVMGTYVAPVAAQTVTGNFTVIDTIPPRAITNLRVASSTFDSVTLAWTATGDDDAVGTATSYDLRYAVFPITSEAEWAAATYLTGEPVPHVSGSAETFTVNGLTSGIVCYFAIKAADEIPNISGLSNGVWGITSSGSAGSAVLIGLLPAPTPKSSPAPTPTATPSAMPEIGITPEPTPSATPEAEPTPEPTPASTPAIEPTPGATPPSLDLRNPDLVGANSPDPRAHGISMWTWVWFGIAGLLTVGLIFLSVRRWRREQLGHEDD